MQINALNVTEDKMRDAIKHAAAVWKLNAQLYELFCLNHHQAVLKDLVQIG
ncbi:MAG: hypothetical protein FWB96_08285 [Defluviitaleaceae bacterium]|nr:hypothetical protein [Defluviitaleaceae bacterium]MCL2224948.1 hypothetical protein [Defluviitaleaceae bacterium]MCL2262491.1 hypothetical protein [Defluviitaleaceae bacterium]